MQTCNSVYIYRSATGSKKTKYNTLIGSETLLNSFTKSTQKVALHDSETLKSSTYLQGIPHHLHHPAEAILNTTAFDAF